MTTNKDQLLRFMLENSDMRGAIVHLDTSYKAACEHQLIAPALKSLLGEFLVGASLLNASMKREGILTLQAQGRGALRLIAAETDSDKHIRGIVRFDPTQSSSMNYLQALPDLLENGVLFLTLDPSQGQRYQGIVPLEQACLSECLEDYFTKSEQTPTLFKIFSDGERCGGLLLQCLPPKSVTDADNRLELWQTVAHLCATLNAEEFFQNSQSDLLFRLFHELGCRIYEPAPITFKCSCSRERSMSAINTLGREDAMALLEEHGSIDIDCEFCGVRYSFGELEVEELFRTGSRHH